MNVTHRRSPARRLLVGSAVAAVAATALAGCVGGPPETDPSQGGGDGLEQYVLTPETVPADADATITVWVDEARIGGFEAFAQAYPEYTFEIQSIGGEDFLTKIQLANRAQSGWPDILWPSDHLPLLASGQYDYWTQPLNGIVPEDILEGFGSNLDAFTTAEGHIVGLRNDIAPSVMFYNVERFEELGYDVPETMDDLVDLAEQVAVEHPDFVMQINGQTWQTGLQFFQSSGCPYGQPLADGSLRIAITDPTCQRAADVIDRLIAAGVYPVDALSDAQRQALGSEGRILLSINAAWRGDYTFPGWNWPEGTLGVAPMPMWGDGDENNRVGNEGGGAFAISRHAQNMKGALEAVIWVATSEETQLAAPTLPAYLPVQERWLAEKVPLNALYADASAVQDAFAASATRIDPVNAITTVDPVGTFPMDRLQGGSTVAELLENWATRMAAQAQSSGLIVVTD